MATTADQQQISKNKTYPHTEEDITHEKEIVDAIKKVNLNQRFQFIALNNIMLQKKQQDADMDVEMKAIVNKFNKIQEPISKAADELILGRPANETESEKIKAHLNDEELTKFNEANKQEMIPAYWVTAIKNCPQLSTLVEEHDRPILDHLNQIDYKTEDDNEDFTIVFHFSPNEFFENSSLKVKFFMLNESEAKHTEADEIKWKEGKNITKKTVTKKQKNKKTGKTREIKKEVDAESFFNLFKTINIDTDADNVDEEEADGLLEKLDLNLQIAQSIENELLPYHLEYFLGVREPSEDGDYDEMGDDDGDDDDDDESDDEPKAKSKAKPQKKDSGEAPKTGQQKEECKQQ